MSEFVTGAEELKAKLKALGPELARVQGGRALYQEAKILEAISHDRTPFDDGPLRASYETSEPIEESDGNVSVTISVGGPSAPYAVYVHEILWHHHPIGEAKFLEKTINEAMPTLSGRLAARITL